MTSKFQSISSEKFRHTVIAIQELVSEEGLECAKRAYAEAIHDSIRNEYQLQNNLTPSTDGHVCVYRLKGVEKCPDKYNGTGVAKCELRVPIADHLSEWLKDGKTYSIVSQPWSISFSEMKELISFCDSHQLKAYISANHAWDFPGKRLFIEFQPGRSG